MATNGAEATEIGDQAGSPVGPTAPVSAMSVDAADFRAAMGSFATGVSIMTAVVDGVPHGMTASAVSSVSLDPPLVLVCVARDALMAERVVDAGSFALSFLAEDQAEVSNGLADPTRTKGPEEFAGLAIRSERTGSPIVAGNVGWVDCRVWSLNDGGDHLVVIGEVLAVGSDRDAPLLYYRGGYGRFATDAPSTPDATPSDHTPPGPTPPGPT